MIQLMVLILILILGVAFGLSLEDKDGILIIAYQGKSYEMALWFGGLIIIISFFIFHYFLQLLGGLFSLGRRIQDMIARFRRKKVNDL